jgi:hypothetical protein
MGEKLREEVSKAGIWGGALARPRRMHQTTVRFGPELWRMLEAETERMGVSVAHYVREAALARLAYAAGQRSIGGESSLEWADPRIESGHLLAERAQAARSE